VGQHDVLRLEVAVHHAAGVAEGDETQQRAREVGGGALVKVAAVERG
jgi:hypothetical protein